MLKPNYLFVYYLIKYDPDPLWSICFATFTRCTFFLKIQVFRYEFSIVLQFGNLSIYSKTVRIDLWSIVFDLHKVYELCNTQRETSKTLQSLYI